MKVGIAGAGLVGRLLALRCLMKGWDVTLFDQDRGGGELSCGQVAAGMIAPYSESEITQPMITQLGVYSLQCWPQIFNQLNAASIFQMKGSVVIAHPQDQMELNKLKERYQKMPLVQAAISSLNRDQLKSLEPELPGCFSQGLYFANEGHVITSEFFVELKNTLLKKDVAWHTAQKVHTINANQIFVNSDAHSFDLVCDCRGLGAKEDLSNLRGVRGELIHLYAPEVHLQRPIRLLHPRYQLYIVPRRDSHYVVGATTIESEDYSPISVKSALELLSTVYTVHPGFAEARILTTAVQCRPVFPDHLPRIIIRDGLLVINGLYRHGYLVAPALIEDVFNYLEKGMSGMQFPELLCKSY